MLLKSHEWVTTVESRKAEVESLKLTADDADDTDRATKSQGSFSLLTRGTIEIEELGLRGGDGWRTPSNAVGELAVTMQTDFNAKTQRCRGAKAENGWNLESEAHLSVTAADRFSGLGFLSSSASLPLCALALKVSDE